MVAIENAMRLQALALAQLYARYLRMRSTRTVRRLTASVNKPPGSRAQVRCLNEEPPTDRRGQRLGEMFEAVTR